MTIAKIKASLASANIPAWAMMPATDTDGTAGIWVDYDSLEAYAAAPDAVATIKALGGIQTDKGISFFAK